MDRAEPRVGAGDEFSLLPARFLAREVGHAAGLQPIVVHQVHRRFGKKMRAIEPVRPGAAIVYARAGRRREHADPIDLDVRRTRVLNGGKNLLVIRNDR